MADYRAMTGQRRVLFLFLDGVGIGPSDPALNPFLSAQLPTLRSLLQDRLPVLDEDPPAGPQAVVLPLDATMGVDGLPQSGTGHVALFTGETAASLYGRHFGPWVPVPLRPLLLEKNLLYLAQEAGRSCVFANAYPSQYMYRARTKRPAGPPLIAHSAGLLTRDETHLARGEAVSSEIVNSSWRTRLGLTHLPEISPHEAGQNLAGMVQGAELTLFAHYFTDTAGHERTIEAGVAALERVDAFLGGLLEELLSETLLVLASDHGNIEDVTQGHTRNPTFNLLYGPDAIQVAQGLSKITDLTPALLQYLNGES